jgi:hypothetical protein
MDQRLSGLNLATHFLCHFFIEQTGFGFRGRISFFINLNLGILSGTSRLLTSSATHGKGDNKIEYKEKKRETVSFKLIHFSGN